MHEEAGAATVDACVDVELDGYRVTVDVLEKLPSTPAKAEPARAAVVARYWMCIVAVAGGVESSRLWMDVMMWR